MSKSKIIANKSISEWAIEWGVSRQAASKYFKLNSHLSIEEIIETKNTKIKKNHVKTTKWIRISGKTIKEWAEDWGLCHSGALYELKKMYPDHYKN